MGNKPTQMHQNIEDNISLQNSNPLTTYTSYQNNQKSQYNYGSPKGQKTQNKEKSQSQQQQIQMNTYKKSNEKLNAKIIVLKIQKDQYFLHSYTLQQLEESFKLFQKHCTQYLQESGIVHENPYQMIQLQQKLMQNLYEETEIISEQKINNQLYQSLEYNNNNNYGENQANNYFDMSYNNQNNLRRVQRKRTGMKSFLRLNSTVSPSQSFKVDNASMIEVRIQQLNQNQLDLDGDANFQDKEELYNSLFIYKAITKLIEKQIKIEGHPLNIIKKIYIEHLINYFSLSKVKQPDSVKLSEDFKNFLEFYLEAISSYYDLTQLIESYKFNVEHFVNEENLLNFLSSVVLNDQYLYSLALQYIQKEDEKQDKVIQKYKTNLFKLKTKSITFYDIPVQFRLNKETIRYHEKKNNITIPKPKFHQNNYNLQISGIKKQERSITLFTPQKPENNNENENETEKESEKKKKNFKNYTPSIENEGPHQHYLPHQPYEKVIKYIKKLQIFRPPLQKIKIILKATDLIDQEIKDFYTQNNINQTRKIHYDADQFIAIFIYIIVQAQLENLYEFTKLIELYTYPGVLNCASGYLLVTLQGCVHHIAGMDNIDNYNNNINNNLRNQSFSQSFQANSYFQTINMAANNSSKFMADQFQNKSVVGSLQPKQFLNQNKMEQQQQQKGQKHKFSVNIQSDLENSDDDKNSDTDVKPYSIILQEDDENNFPKFQKGKKQNISHFKQINSLNINNLQQKSNSLQNQHLRQYEPQQPSTPVFY
ncbi:hypothetical protein PPERSA_11437 [Pseudocohnilembus persalinus]|uniref:VPS9 domain-containing protein n=1 Tax=Pseudocohnilembus persalinus TaxID=266149 RepID=A0A0V0QY09_PSEPJ|nr:hypothetical protein PPERSA_11437 [Pseudocohnilembus persalinus]|eukprot:KRX06792.1 hypothetical protein PPERSA_11437 [Pseudocohnilembus persalinus]